MKKNGNGNTDTGSVYRRVNHGKTMKQKYQYFMKKRLPESWILLLFLAPVLIYFVVFHYWPLYGVQIAFKDYSVRAGIWGSQWVGLKHFIRFFSNPTAVQSIWNTLSVSVLGILIGTPVPIILALSLNIVRVNSAKRVMQTVIYLPHFVSVTVIVGMMTLMLSPTTGVVNTLIKVLGFEPYYFMAKPEAFKWLYVASGIWQSAGYSTIIYLATLSAVNPELYEAIEIDGGNLLHRIRFIDFPSVLPTLTIVMMLRIGHLLNLGFIKALLMQNDLNVTSSEFIQTYVYKTGLLQGDFDFATAIGFFNTIVSVIIIITFNYLARKYSSTRLY